MRARSLLTGASGYVGAQLAQSMAAHFDLYSAFFSSPARVTAGTPLALDLRDEAAVRHTLAALQPEVIIHTAASNRDEQNLTAIVPAARALADYAGKAGARLIHVSSDMVFGGLRPPYADDSACDPIVPYGSLKAEAEQWVRALCLQAVIVRPSLVYGLYPIDPQTMWLVEGLRHRQTVRLFTDEIRCPIWVDDLCAALFELAAFPRLEEPETMNLGGPQPLSRWEFGIRLLAALGISPGPTLARSTIRQSGLTRPQDLTMISSRASRLLCTRLRPVDDVLSPDSRPAAPVAVAPIPEPSRSRRPRYCEG